MEALSHLRRLGKKAVATDAVLAFDGQTFTVALPTFSTGMAATGEWEGKVRVPRGGLFFLQVGKVKLKPEEVGIRIEDGTLHVNQFSTGCLLMGAGEPPVRPAEPSLLSVLRQAEASGVWPGQEVDPELRAKVFTAMERRDALVRKAAVALADLGVTLAEVRELVNQKIKGKDSE